MRHPLHTLAALALLGGIACRDTIPPTAPPSTVASATHTVIAAGPVVVTPADMHGWAFEEDGPHGGCADLSRCHLIEGPDTPPLGTGSAALAPTHHSSAAIALDGYAGVRLDQVHELRYSTYVRPGSKRDDAGVTLRLSVDYDLAHPASHDMGQLVHAPSPLQPGVWQRWDARAGQWWGTEEVVRVGRRTAKNPCTERAPCTWATLLQRFPDIGFHTMHGGLRVVAERDGDVTVFVDEVVIGVGSATTTYDFETRLPPTGPESLTVMTDDGVIGYPVDADTTYAHGTSVPYAFDAPADARILSVWLDGVVVPNHGAVLMNARHVLYAGLHADLAPRAGDQPLIDALRAVLVSADPVSAFQSLMDLSGQTYAELGEDDATARMNRVIAASIDPVRDSAALRRVDDALGGHLFEIRESGVGSASAMRSASGSRSAGASRTIVTGNGTAEPTAVVYVNGVGNSIGDAMKTRGHLGYLLRRYVSQFADPHDVIMRLMYNHNDASSNPPASPRACAVRAGAGGILPFLVAYTSCRGIAMASPVTSIIADLAESVRIMSGKELPSSGPVLVDIAALAGAIKTFAEEGRHVVIIPHSEGNLITERALAQLGADKVLVTNANPYCVSVVPLASPTTHYGPVDARYVRPVQLAGDVILLSPRVGTGADVYPATANSIDDRLTAQRAARTGTDALRYLRQLIDGVTIHTMDSYLAPEGESDLVMTAAADAYSRCAVGPVTLNGPRDAEWPQQYTMLLGSTAQYTATATNGAGDPIALRPVWSAEGPVTVTDDGLLTAVSLGTGFLRVRIGLSPAELLVTMWSKPPVILSVSCVPGETRYDGYDMITTWTSTIVAQPSTPYAPIASYGFQLEEKLRWSGADRLGAEPFQHQSGNTATTVITRSQSILMDGTPDGGQWMPTGRCIGRVADVFGKSVTQYSP